MRKKEKKYERTHHKTCKLRQRTRYTINAFEKKIEWHKPNDMIEKTGIRNFRFGDIVTDIVANGKTIYIKSNGAYTLVVNGISYDVSSGENTFEL